MTEAPVVGSVTDSPAPSGDSGVATKAKPSVVRDFIELTKPRIAVLVLISVAAGAYLAGELEPHRFSWLLLIHAVVGSGLVAGGASALNQVLERKTDALMIRTANRPLPAQRLTPLAATVFGIALGIAGTIELLVFLPSPACAIAAILTLLGYVLVYTPLKTITDLNTIVGAAPGATPPILGYLAISGKMDGPAWSLFLILFIWQIPHFLAIAWMYKDQYAGAGMKMLTVRDHTGYSTGLQMVLYCLALLLVSWSPFLLFPPERRPGLVYLIGSMLSGLMFLAAAIRFFREPGVPLARKALRASLLHWPLVLGFLLMDQARPLPEVPGPKLPLGPKQNKTETVDGNKP